MEIVKFELFLYTLSKDDWSWFTLWKYSIYVSIYTYAYGMALMILNGFQKPISLQKCYLYIKKGSISQRL